MLRTASKNRKQGVTLVEVAVAILLITILAIAAIKAIRYPRDRAVTDMHKQGAILAADSAMEKALALGYGHVQMQPGTYDLSDTAQRYSMHGITLTGERKVEDIKQDGFNFKRVTITVDYPGSGIPVVVQSLLYRGKDEN